MDFNGTVINDSPTFVAAAGAAITTGPFTAVAFSKGSFIASTSSTVPFGITVAETDNPVAVGDDVTAQIKDISAWKAGGTFAAGDALACDDTGCAIKAAAGKYVLGYALEEATAAGQVVRVQITKSGIVATA
jgi:hypothetical protein